MPTASQLPPEQIDQMVAPIALYPDPLVAQILMASTYPLEVVEANRWIQYPGNAQLQGDQLAAALEQQPWDPSVKSLVPFPQVLQTLNQNIEWTEQLGNAFLSQPVDVTNAIQQLRYSAEQSGALQSTPQQTVSMQGSSIVIEPANPAVVYIPYYNPDTVYGTWPYPDYQPYYFSTYNSAIGFGLGFATGIAVIEPLWYWNRWDWRHHRIDIDNNRFSRLNEGRPPEHPGVWQHDTDHRHGVPYANPAQQSHYINRTPSPVTNTVNLRGYEQRQGEPQRLEDRRVAGPRPVAVPTAVPTATVPQRQEQYHTMPRVQAPAAPEIIPQMRAQPQVLRQAPEVQRAQVQQAPRAAPVFESFSRGSEVRQQQQRGFESRSPAAQNHPAGHSAGPNMERERH
jgi:hypothetical protein